jgi:hypothetical protein
MLVVASDQLWAGSVANPVAENELESRTVRVPPFLTGLALAVVELPLPDGTWEFEPQPARAAAAARTAPPESSAERGIRR